MSQAKEQTQNNDRKSDHFPCPSCGGIMHFDPASATLKCPFCDHVIDFKREDDVIREHDLFSLNEEAVKTQDWSGDNLTIKCENCGAQTVVSSETMAEFCAFCGSAHVVKIDEFNGIAPESVLPFSITAKQAKDCFKRWISKRWFAPKALKKENEAGRIKGAYIPYWTYDSDTSYTYTAMAGDYYYVTRTRMVNGERKTEQVRKIRWRPVHGSGRRYFDDIQVSATNNLNRRYIDKLEPFNLSRLTPYQSEFLSGFQAERYSIDVKEGWSEAKQEINSALHSDVRSSIHADEVRNIKLMVTYNTVKYKHLLVPIWLSSYMYREKTYQVMINGDNGKVAGKFPISFWKVFSVVVGGLAIIG